MCDIEHNKNVFGCNNHFFYSKILRGSEWLNELPEKKERAKKISHISVISPRQQEDYSFSDVSSEKNFILTLVS